MNVLRRIVVGLAGVVVVALAIELAAPKAVHALVSTLVTVTNTSANPVPVTGDVNATLTGTPTVNISTPLTIGGNVNATVSNPAGTNGPVPLVTAEANNPAYQPASIKLAMLSAASTSVTAPSFLPSGGPFRELVINWVSGLCLSGGYAPTLIALQTDGSQISIFSASSSNTSTRGLGQAFFGSRTNLYASPGSIITLEALVGDLDFDDSPEQITVNPIPKWDCLINADGYYVTQ